MEKRQPSVIPVKREISERKMLSALQFFNKVKKKKPTFLHSQDRGVLKEIQAPKAIQKVNVMPTELPKKLPPRMKVNYVIELQLEAKSPPFPLLHSASKVKKS